MAEGEDKVDLTKILGKKAEAPKLDIGAVLSMLDFADAQDANEGGGLDLGHLFGKINLQGLDLRKLLQIVTLVNAVIKAVKPPKVAQPPAVIDDTKVPPTSVPAGEEDEDEVEPESGRLITSLHAKVFYISRQNRVLDKTEFDEILARRQPLNARDRVHLDITPYDQFGKEVGPGSPELEQLVLTRFAEDRVTPLEYPKLRLRFLQPVDGVWELTNEYNDFGMTPVLKVPKGLKLSREAELGTFALEFQPAERPKIVSNELPSLRVKPWAE